MGMPDEDRVPPGPHRRFLEAVHELRDLAGRPSSRTISEWINTDGDLPGTMSHAQVAGLFNGQRLATGLPVRALVMALAKRANPPRDPAAEAQRVEELWRSADNERVGERGVLRGEATGGGELSSAPSRTAISHAVLSSNGLNQRADAVGRVWTPAQALNVLDQAVRTTAGITDPPLKALALAGMAQALAKVNIERARNIAGEAARTAAEITDVWRREELLASIAGAVGEADPDLALGIAADIGQPAWRARALAWTAQALATADPERAREIAGRSQRAASEIIKIAGNAPLLADIAVALATVDPHLAQQAAWSIEAKIGRIAYLRAEALAEIVPAFATSEPEHGGDLLLQAEGLALSIKEPEWRIRAFAAIARALGTTSPERARVLAMTAERAVQEVPHAVLQDELRAQIAAALATPHSYEAARIVSGITDPAWKARALAALAGALATTEPRRARDLADQADRIAANITNVSHRPLTMAEIDEALDEIARALSVVDPDRALRIAASISSTLDRAPALAAVAAAWIVADIR